MCSLQHTAAMFEYLEGRLFLAADSTLAALAAPTSTTAEAHTDNVGGWSGKAGTIALDSSGAGSADSWIDTGADQDMYKVVATKTGAMTLTATNTAAAPTSRMQLNLYNSSCSYLTSAAATTASDPAGVTYNVTAGSTYYVKALSANLTPDPFRLTVATAGPNTAPVLEAIAPIAAVEGQKVSFEVKATDADGDALAYSMTNLPSGATFDTQTRMFNWTPAAGQAGTYNPVVSVSDGTVEKTQAVNVTVTPRVDTVGGWSGKAGTITLDSSGAGSTDSWIDTGADQDMYKIVATKTGAMTLTATNTAATPASRMQLNFYNSSCSYLASAAATTASDPASVTYNVTAGSTYYVKALSANATADPFRLSVSMAAPNQAPVMQAIPAVSGEEGKAISFVVSATDPDGNALTYSASNLPTGSTFNASTRTFSWTPAAGQAGAHSPVFTVSDGKLTASQTANITVAKPNQAPVMQAIPAVSGQEGKAISFVVSATDPDGNPLTYSASNLPTGSTFNASTRTFNWTPAAGQAGTYSPVFTVSDGKLTASQTAAITVSAAVPTPPGDNVGGWSGTAGTVTLSSSGTGSVDGWIDTATDQDMYKVVATKSGAMTLTATNTAATPTSLMQINFYDSTASGALDSKAATTASGAASITYNVSAGATYYVKVLSANSKTDPFRLAVTTDVVNQAPTMNPIAPVSVAPNTKVQFTVSATDPDGDTLTYSASNLPSGAAFDASTRTFTWTPTATGSWSPVFTVSDGKLTASQTASITASTTPTGGDGTNDKGKMGAGGTTATYIDPDNDGYGVNAPNGPDADPNDPNVNTYAQALAKYGSVTGILNNLGYNPQRIFYISTSGNNSTGVVNDMSRPFANWDGVDNLLKPGDAVIYRAGTYTSGTSANAAVITADPGYSANGTASNPITVMGMPGEKVTLQANPNTTNRTNGIWYTGSYYNFDNFNITGGTYMGSGVKVAYNAAYGTFKNINTYGNAWGVQVNGTWSHLTFDSIVSHDNTAQGGEHGIYLGSSGTYESPSDTAVIRNSVIFGNGNTSIGQGIHANGAMTNVLVEGNIIRNNGTTGIDLMNGVRNSVFRNNVVFSHPNAQAFIISNYGTGTGYTAAMDNNTIINNTFIGSSGTSGRANVIRVNVDSNSSVKNLTIANNILYMDYVGGGSNPTVIQLDNNLWTSTMTIQNNVGFNENNTTFLKVGSTNYTLSQAQGLSSLIKGNVWGDPKLSNYTGGTNSDFDLLAGSPAINLGLTSGAPLTDMRGDTRVGNPDAGAYEYHA